MKKERGRVLCGAGKDEERALRFAERKLINELTFSLSVCATPALLRAFRCTGRIERNSIETRSRLLREKKKAFNGIPDIRVLVRVDKYRLLHFIFHFTVTCDNSTFQPATASNWADSLITIATTITRCCGCRKLWTVCRKSRTPPPPPSPTFWNTWHFQRICKVPTVNYYYYYACREGHEKISKERKSGGTFQICYSVFIAGQVTSPAL